MHGPTRYHFCCTYHRLSHSSMHTEPRYPYACPTLNLQFSDISSQCCGSQTTCQWLQGIQYAPLRRPLRNSEQPSQIPRSTSISKRQSMFHVLCSFADHVALQVSEWIRLPCFTGLKRSEAQNSMERHTCLTAWSCSSSRVTSLSWDS
jgi:hypothetical protein